jgi:hypothetical protein
MNSPITIALLFSTLLLACATPSPQTEQPIKSPREKAAEQTTITRPALRDELLEMREEDQAVRAVLMQAMQAGQADSVPQELLEQGKAIDLENTERLKEIIEELGRWPGTDLVGQEGADAAWLLAQHADQSPKAQKFFVEKLRIAVEEGKAPPKHYAYLVDRVRLRDGKTQLYGTQFDVVAGELELKPVEDPDELDERREKMGLEPVDEYLERSRKMFLPEAE